MSLKSLSSLVILIAVFCNLSFAEKKKDKNKSSTTETVVAPPPAKPAPKDAMKSIKDVTEKAVAYPGLLPLYQDSATGKVYIEVSEKLLGKSFIFFRYAQDAVVEAGAFRGAFMDNKVIKINKYFDRIEISIVNTAFYFDSTNAISKASNANINEPIVVSEKIIAMQTDTLDTLGNTLKRYLIDADAVFLQESLGQIKRSKSPNEAPDAFTMGSLSSKKTKYTLLKNYPANTDVVVEYVYENPYPTNSGSDAITDARSVSIKLRNSIIQMPENDYQPRYDDPRVGYFLDQSTDLTSTSVIPYKDKINRWNLVKKDPNAAISEPVEPITFWMENTTPVNLRPVIKEAVEKWNIAFEKAGFKNAVVCLQQPDTADWDAGDIRYNVIRWTSSPNPPFGGYGPSFTNPLTGQILGADIMLEWIYIINRIRVEEIYGISNHSEFENQLSDKHFCSAGNAMHQNILYGMHMLTANDVDSILKGEFNQQALMDLVLHEVGHTLGLNHNFIASMLRTPEEIHNKVLGETKGLTGSVMDYTVPNISKDKTKQGLYFDNTPGPYDIWAITYGYTPFSKETEAKGLDSILALSSKPENRFLNDADDMRVPGKGIDPRVMLFDMSSDPVGYAIDQLDLISGTMKTIKGKFIKNGQSYQELRVAYTILSGNYNRNLQTLSRWIGGIFVDRSFAGQNPSVKPFTPVSLQEQKRALQAIAKYSFAPEAYKVEDDIFNYLQVQRRGYETPFDGETLKIHDRILNSQKSLLDHLLHYNTLTRILDSKELGNEYSLNAVLNDLTDAIYKQDLNGNVNTVRQNLQVEYLNRLLSIVSSGQKYNQVVKGAVFGEIQKIKKIALTPSGDAATKSHRAYMLYLIDATLKKD